MLNTRILLMGASILSSAMIVYAQKSPVNFKLLERDKNVKTRNVTTQEYFPAISYPPLNGSSFVM